jgi:hypothetical protein
MTLNNKDRMKHIHKVMQLALVSYDKLPQLNTASGACTDLQFKLVNVFLRKAIPFHISVLLELCFDTVKHPTAGE